VVKRDGDCMRVRRWRDKDKNPPKPCSHSVVDKHLLDEHPKKGVNSSSHSRLLGEGMLTKKTVSDALVRKAIIDQTNVEQTSSEIVTTCPRHRRRKMCLQRRLKYILSGQLPAGGMHD